MNIIFMGTPQFAVPSLNILLNSHHKISAVVTVPDKPKGRGQHLAQSDVKKFAAEAGLNILQPDSLKDPDFIEELKSLSPDLIVVVAFRILPKSVFKLPKFGSINLHASLLPKYRGAAPINWAVINGERETGVTTFFLQEKVDTGSIIMQKSIDIHTDDTAGTVHDKLMKIGAEVVFDTVDLIENTNGAPPAARQNNGEATPAPKIFKDDCRIDFDQAVDKVYDFIRGLSPYPGAFTEYRGKQIKIFSTSKSHWDSLKGPGRFFIKEGKLYVSTLNEFLEITELQMEGKKRMSSAEFLNGYSDLFKKFKG
ncbi:MAG TPA: methionyl-tRNA formyltransferase [Ignavibacteria bacterium]|nr:methionyl-tRNA formyltransferase [Ignavibacteria bacterium]